MSTLPDQLPPDEDIAKLETLTSIKAATLPMIAISPFSPQMSAFSEQPTWILPVIPGQAPLSPQLSQDVSGQGYVDIARNMVKSSGIYALSSLASPLLSLLLVPFLTRFLSKTDYGALVVLNIFVTLLAGVTQLGMGDAFFRSYNLSEDRDRMMVPSTLLLMLCCISIPVTLVIIVAAPWLSAALLNDPSFGNALRVVALVVLLQNLSIPGLALRRAENRALSYSALSLLSLLVNGGLTIYLVAFLQLGIIGALMAMACGYFVIMLYTIPALFLRTGLRWRPAIARDLLAVGSPHVVNLLSGWVLQLIDRFLLGRLGSLSQTASYAVAYSLGGVLSAVIITPFSMVWWATIFSIARKPNAQRIFRLIFRWFGLILLCTTFGLAFAGTGVLDLFFPPAYLAAAPVIPVIALSTMFSGIYVIFSLGISLQGKTWIASLLITGAAVINVICNLLLIPLFAAMGAALATLLAYFLLVIASYFVNRRLYPVPFETGLFALALSVGIALYTGSELLSRSHIWLVGWGLHCSALLFYIGCLILLGMLPARHPEGVEEG